MLFARPGISALYRRDNARFCGLRTAFVTALAFSHGGAAALDGAGHLSLPSARLLLVTFVRRGLPFLVLCSWLRRWYCASALACRLALQRRRMPCPSLSHMV